MRTESDGALRQRLLAWVRSVSIAAAIPIATSSNGLLKAVYAIAFSGGWETAPSAAVLVALAGGGLTMAVYMRGWR